jgi:uncharacterized protein (TIGR02594 family)
VARVAASRNEAGDQWQASAWPRAEWNSDRAYQRQTRKDRRRANQAWSSAFAGTTSPDRSSQPSVEADARLPSTRVSRGHAAARPTSQDQVASATGFAAGANGLVAEARRWIGTNPTNRRSLWCAAFMNFVLQRNGHEGTGSDLAKSFASIGRRVSGPQVGAIAVMSRRGGGHVGVVSGVDSAGNPIIVSGNSRGRRVAEGTYPRGRVYAYVMP